jgi:hypothetical protein
MGDVPRTLYEHCALLGSVGAGLGDHGCDRLLNEEDCAGSLIG